MRRHFYLLILLIPLLLGHAPGSDAPSTGATGGSGTDADAIHDNVASEISAITEKASPVNADLIIIEDSADSNNKKRVQVGNLPTGAGGENNTHSSDGGGLALTAATPKVGVDLRLISLAASDFSLTADVATIDDDSHNHAAGNITGTDAGTDLTADLEEEGELGNSALSNNASNDRMIVGTGLNTADWFALPAGGTDGCSGGADKPTYVASTNTWGCGTDDDVPDAGDFGNATDLDSNGEVANDSHDHTTTTISGLADGDISNTLTSSQLTSAVADPADAGIVRLGNAETICWEASPTGTDTCLSVDSNERLQITGVSGDLSLIDIDAGAGPGPILRLVRDSASPAASDQLARINYDSASGQTYARLDATILDATGASEDGSWDIITVVAGALADRFHFAQGMYSDGATGGDQGVDTVNASALYDDGLQLATLASPAFTGGPTAPTPAVGDADTSVATTLFVQDETVATGDISGSLGGGFTLDTDAVDTLTEIAVALKSGLDAELITGTIATTDRGVKIDANDDLVESQFSPDTGAYATTKTECVYLNAGASIQPAAETSEIVVEEGTNFPYTVVNFDDTNDEIITWNYGLPNNIAGTTATVRISWLTLACTAASADDVCWVWNGGGFLDDEAFDGGSFSGTEAFNQDKCTTVGDIHTTAATTWTHGYDVASPKDTEAVFSIQREQIADATCTGDNDDISGDVQLKLVQICYEIMNIFSGEGG